MNLLELRKVFLKAYKSHEDIYNYILKFIFLFIVYSYIFGLDAQMSQFDFLQSGFVGLLYKIGVAGISTILPVGLLYGLMIANIGIMLSSNIIISGMTMLIMLCILFFYARIAIDESILILVTVAAIYLRIPFVMPVIAGLYFGLSSCIAIANGVFIYGYMEIVRNSIVPTALNEMSIDTAMSEVSVFIENITGNTQFIIVAFMYVVATIIVVLVSKMDIKNNFYVAIVSSVVFMTVGYIVLNVVGIHTGYSYLSIFVAGILSLVISLVIQTMDFVLDYDKMSKVQFQDEDNYYYVKVIPKYLVDDKK